MPATERNADIGVYYKTVTTDCLFKIIGLVCGFGYTCIILHLFTL